MKKIRYKKSETFSFTNAIKNTFSILKDVKFYGLVFLFWFLISASLMLMFFIKNLPSLIFSAILIIFFNIFFNSTAIAYLYDPEESFTEILKRGASFIPRFFAISLLLGLILAILIIPLLFTIVYFASPYIMPSFLVFPKTLSPTNFVVIFILLIVLLVLTIYVSNKLSLSTFLYVLDEKDLIDSLKISWKNVNALSILKMVCGIIIISIFVALTFGLLTGLLEYFIELEPNVFVFLNSLVSGFLIIAFYFNVYKELA